VKVLELNNTHFLVLATNKVAMYKFEDAEVVKRLPYTLPAGLNDLIKEFTDGAV